VYGLYEYEYKMSIWMMRQEKREMIRRITCNNAKLNIFVGKRKEKKKA
jgi:hypothetical protein